MTLLVDLFRFPIPGNDLSRPASEHLVLPGDPRGYTLGGTTKIPINGRIIAYTAQTSRFQNAVPILLMEAEKLSMVWVKKNASQNGNMNYQWYSPALLDGTGGWRWDLTKKQGHLLKVGGSLGENKTAGNLDGFDQNTDIDFLKQFEDIFLIIGGSEQKTHP